MSNRRREASTARACALCRCLRRECVPSGAHRRQAGQGPASRMGGEHMRRRLLFVVALVVLALPAPASAGQGFSMKLGSTFTITGRTGSDAGKHSRALGKVVLSGHWGLGPWRVLMTT